MIEYRASVAPLVMARDSSGGSNVVTGIAVPFGEMADIGRFLEVVDAGAFDAGIAAGWGPHGVMSQYQHGDLVLGSTRSGTLTLSKTPAGLRYAVRLPDAAALVRELVARGDLGGASMGFAAVRDEWSMTPEGDPVRTLLEIRLYEVSLVGQPAYRGTSADIASGPSVGRSVPPEPASAPVLDLADARAKLAARERWIMYDRLLEHRLRLLDLDMPKRRRP